MMSFEQALPKAYAETTQRTLQQWQKNPAAGRMLPAPYHQTRLGVSTGNVFRPTGWLADLHHELTGYATGDSRLDVVPQSSMHFTFLALATSVFEKITDLPKEVKSLIPLYEAYVRPLTFRVRQVSLLPLERALLLAGIPDIKAFEARQQFAEAILQSAWAPWLKDRYRHHSIPPLFWHTTVARYNAEFLPQAVRTIYQRYSAESLPVIEIGQSILAAATYNWSRVIEITHNSK